MVAPSDEGFHRAARLADLAPGKGLAVRIAGRDIALFRTGEGLFAIADVCPHQHAPLSEGTLEGRVVECAWHGWRFDLATGSFPGMTGCPRVERFPVRVRDDGWVEVGESPLPPG